MDALLIPVCPLITVTFPAPNPQQVELVIDFAAKGTAGRCLARESPGHARGEG